MFSDKPSIKRINAPLPECEDGHLSFFKDMDEILLKAAKNGHSHCVKTLIAAGADVNTVHWKFSTPLSLVYNNLRCADNENKRKQLASTVRLLLEAGAHVNVKNEDGDSLLHLNEWKSECATGKLLLAAGEEVRKLAMKEGKEKSKRKAGKRKKTRKKNDSETAKSSDFAEISVEILKGLCREMIRDYLLDVSPVNLFCTVPQLGLSAALSRYILRGFSLDETFDGDEDDNGKENPKNDEEMQEDSNDQEKGKKMICARLRSDLILQLSAFLRPSISRDTPWSSHVKTS